MKRKKGQEEMIGFALIVIIVAVILVVFLSLSLKKSPESDLPKSNELKSFIQSLLHYTTNYANYEPEYFTIKDLIKDCDRGDNCEILEKELGNILGESWKVQEGGVVKGYKLEITSVGEEILKIQEGEETQEWKADSQPLSDIEIRFSVYY